MLRIIKTKHSTVGKTTYERLRIVVNLRREDIERLGWKEGDEIEAADHKDGILLKRAAKGEGSR